MNIDMHRVRDERTNALAGPLALLFEVSVIFPRDGNNGTNAVRHSASMMHGVIGLFYMTGLRNIYKPPPTPLHLFTVEAISCK